MKLKDEKKLLAIVQATCQVVAERGLSNLMLADIARCAGIATSTIYVYFKSKELLLDAVYKQTKEATFHRYMDQDDPHAPVVKRIRILWEKMLTHDLENHVEIVFQEQYYNSQYMSQANRELSAQFATVFFALIDKGQREKFLKPIAPLFLIRAVVASVRETAYLIRTAAVSDSAASRDTGFLLCWDALRFHSLKENE